jgi:hypothetical protein
MVKVPVFVSLEAESSVWVAEGDTKLPSPRPMTLRVKEKRVSLMKNES